MRIIGVVTLLVVLSGACSDRAGTAQKRMLRHVVLFGFNDGVPASEVQEIERAFANLPRQIDVIRGYEWGTDCSPEGLQGGHSHCFFLSFDTEQDRDAYLIHPAHKAFGQLTGGKLKAITVVDYWAQ